MNLLIDYNLNSSSKITDANYVDTKNYFKYKYNNLKYYTNYVCKKDNDRNCFNSYQYYKQNLNTINKENILNNNFNITNEYE